MLLGDSCSVGPVRPVCPVPSRPPKASHIFLTPKLRDVIFLAKVFPKMARYASKVSITGAVELYHYH